MGYVAKWPVHARSGRRRPLDHARSEENEDDGRVLQGLTGGGRGRGLGDGGLPARQRRVDAAQVRIQGRVQG
jgi:hypothetical protein